MDAKAAVRAATSSIQELFGDQIVSDPTLEEIEYVDDDKTWRVTIGFFRVPDMPRSTSTGGALSSVLGQLAGPRRTYKVVRITDGDQTVKSIRDRELP